LGGRSGRGIRDTRLVAKALAESWPIPRNLRRPLVARLAGIVQDPDASPREATAAARAILLASRINLDAVAATIRAREHEELAERIVALEERIDGQRFPRPDRPPGAAPAAPDVAGAGSAD
jgi:hypothetical protein